MRSDKQLDLIRHSDEALIRANKLAAETARVDPFYTYEERERRANHYLAEAAKLEARYAAS